uniref:Uncharacterized protein n=1 Tax=Onchocerca volvulus TaxID=6282 RepID=A0A8R1XXY7_ONCVO
MEQIEIGDFAVEWKEDWSGKLPSGGNGMHKGWVGFGSDHDGGKYVENGWQDSWQSGYNDGKSGWNGKQDFDDSWAASGKHRWSWGNGGSQGWGIWGNGAGKYGPSNHYSTGFGDYGRGSDSYGPKNNYASWGNTNTDNWRNTGGGEGWSEWEVDDHGPGNGGREHGGWKSWKSGSGSGSWDSWNSGNKPVKAKSEAYAYSSIDP